ncbi:hypothetical protein [Saccharopolyspora pogona]|nr:hypothetical protein [Saccharopolyspora pogona]
MRCRQVLIDAGSVYVFAVRIALRHIPPEEGVSLRHGVVKNVAASATGDY